jgi:hypothetical protein
VDIREDHVFWGRRHIAGRIDPDGDWYEYGNRKHEECKRRRRWREDEISWRRSQEDDRRRRHKPEQGITKDKHRSIDIDNFRRRRRRHVIDDRRE